MNEKYSVITSGTIIQRKSEPTAGASSSRARDLMAFLRAATWKGGQGAAGGVEATPHGCASGAHFRRPLFCSSRSAAICEALSAASTVSLPARAALICWPTVTPIDWNSGIAANCTPTYGLLGSVESVGLALLIAFSSAGANFAAATNCGLA